MIDPAGLTLGLAGLYSAAVEVIDRISAAKSYGEDYQLFVTKVRTERLRLFRWGEVVGLARLESEVNTESSQRHGSRIQQHELLQDPEVRDAVTELLAWAVRYFDDAEDVLKRNAVGGSAGGFIAFLPGQRGSKVLSTTGSTVSTFNFPRARAGKFQKDASALSKMKWALSGKRKSEKILQQLSWFVDKLHELLPTSGIQQMVLCPVTELAPTSAIQPVHILEGLPESLPPPPTVRLTGRQSRVEAGARRARKNHIRRIAAGAVAELQLRADVADKKDVEIRVEERYVIISSP